MDAHVDWAGGVSGALGEVLSIGQWSKSATTLRRSSGSREAGTPTVVHCESSCSGTTSAFWVISPYTDGVGHSRPEEIALLVALAIGGGFYVLIFLSALSIDGLTARGTKSCDACRLTRTTALAPSSGVT